MNFQSETNKILKGVKIEYRSCKAFSKEEKDANGVSTVMSSANYEPAYMTVNIKLPKVIIFLIHF